jgi:hypothetical protein
VLEVGAGGCGCWRWLEVTGVGWRWLEVAGSGWSWLEVAGVGLKCQY